MFLLPPFAFSSSFADRGLTPTRIRVGGATQISQRIIEDITEENKQIDLSALERDLETQDRTSDLFYGDDDLAYLDVIAAASKTKA